jgi:hypothetical protein
MGRGGLQNGWGGIGDGYILKATKSAVATSYNDAVLIPLSGYAKRYALRFRGWVWAESGTNLSFNLGIIDAVSTYTLPAANTWTFVDTIFTMSNVTDVDCRIQWNGLGSQAVEMYFAMVNITVPEIGGDGSGICQSYSGS